MNKMETMVIMSMLGAFYSGGKNDPKMQAEAWHQILSKYDFFVAKAAVLKFAENDTRDYATFPAVGKIVEAIREEERAHYKPLYDIKMAISYGRSYDELSGNLKKIISRDMYNEWLGINAEEFEARSGELIDALENKRLIGGA